MKLWGKLSLVAWNGPAVRDAYEAKRTLLARVCDPFDARLHTTAAGERRIRLVVQFPGNHSHVFDLTLGEADALADILNYAVEDARRGTE